MDKRQILIHIHIPKCGGSTFWKFILKHNFRGSFYRDGGLLQDYQYSAAQILKILQTHAWLQCYSSHKVSLDLPFQTPNLNILSVAFVRDPIERFISHYFFHRNHDVSFVPEAKTLDFDGYTQFALEENRQPMYINGQTRFLSGFANEEGLESIRAHVNDGSLFLFPLNCFDEACMILEKSLPNLLKDCSYPLLANKSNPDQIITETQKERIRPFVGIDFKLLAIAQQSLEQLKDDTFLNPELCKRHQMDFYRRCRFKKFFHILKLPLIKFVSGKPLR